MSKVKAVFGDPLPCFIEPCPKCGNDREFTAISSQCAEDLCEVWLECVCGHDPHGPLERMESVMGELDKGSVVAAASCWNEAICRARRGAEKEGGAA